jgi:hypothetical protein
MNGYEQAAFSRLREATISTRPLIEQIKTEQQQAQDFLTCLRFFTRLGPERGRDTMTEQLDQLGRHLLSMFGLVLLMQGIMSQVVAVMSEHAESEEGARPVLDPSQEEVQEHE